MSRIIFNIFGFYVYYPLFYVIILIEVIIVSEFSKKLKLFREEKNMSQKVFAEAIGAKNTTVSNWEKGMARPDIDMIVKICEVLSVSPNELFSIPLTQNEYSNLEKQIIAEYRRKPDLQQAVRILLNIEK